MEDVAIWIEFDGVIGIRSCCRGVLGEEVATDLIELGRAGELAGSSAFSLLVTTDCAVGHGGGKGETDTLVTEAVCARYDFSG
jgi:hypothetical protein